MTGGGRCSQIVDRLPSPPLSPPFLSIYVKERGRPCGRNRLLWVPAEVPPNRSAVYG